MAFGQYRDSDVYISHAAPRRNEFQERALSVHGDMSGNKLEAAAMDVATAGFYVVYAYAFNWGYDRLFPLPEWDEPSG